MVSPESCWTTPVASMSSDRHCPRCQGFGQIRPWTSGGRLQATEALAARHQRNTSLQDGTQARTTLPAGFGQEADLRVLMDAHWAGCPSTGKHTSGALRTIFDRPIHFVSKTQSVIALSPPSEPAQVCVEHFAFDHSSCTPSFGANSTLSWRRALALEKPLRPRSGLPGRPSLFNFGIFACRSSSTGES